MSRSAQDPPRLEHPHTSHFRVVTAVLVGIAVAAVAVAVVVATRNNPRPAINAPWSTWMPDSSGKAGIFEIAQHVSPFYRVSGVEQLGVVTPIALSQTTAAGTTNGTGVTIAVNESGAPKNPSVKLLNGMTVAYNVCGLAATNCEVSGAPSINRMLLLRREALELALYTFKYISHSENVAIVLPPGHIVTSSGAAENALTVAVLFNRPELQPLLTVPLGESLQVYPPDLSQLPSWAKSQEATLVDEITARGLFSTQTEPLQVGGKALVLTALPAQ